MSPDGTLQTSVDEVLALLRPPYSNAEKNLVENTDPAVEITSFPGFEQGNGSGSSAVNVSRENKFDAIRL